MTSFSFLHLRLASTRLVVVLLISLSCLSSTSHGYANTPELNRRAMAGLWRLVTSNPKSLIATPRKEFTTYPKKHQELLLVLQEDGSFTTRHQQQQQQQQDNASYIKGTWDYVDGQLILATDRAAPATIRDIILVGKVVATALHEQDVIYQKNATTTTSSTTTTTTTDTTFLSVPQGSVKVGKFMYPKHHPSFFEQPIYSPVPTGSFELRQVLQNFNAISPSEKEEEEYLEQFQRSDFYDKRFYLTSHPIEHKPKGRLRWSIKYNKFVEDTPRKQSPLENSQQIPIRVMQVAFHTNNTFSTVAGLGDETILRGKWDIIGNTRNQLWMQVWRFGFGRSVSGSVYSEGKGLSDADEKTYWGEISYIEDENKEDNEKSSSDLTRSDTPSSSDDDVNDDDTTKRLQVKGSVFYGWGLEPQPVARFLMKESVNEEEVDNEEEEEEDTREEDLERTFHKETDSDDDIDWSNAFQ